MKLSKHILRTYRRKHLLMGLIDRIVALLLFSVMTLGTNTAYAAQNLALARSSISLEDAIKLTLADNPNLYEFEFRKQILDGESRTANLKPELNVGLELENFLGSGEVSAFKELEATLTLSSVIQLSGKPTAKLNVISARNEQQVVEKQIRTLDLLGELTRRFIHVLSLQSQLDTLQESETLAEYTYSAVSKRVEAGASPQLEKRRAEAALAQSQLEVASAKHKIQVGIRSLSIMWGEQYPTFKAVEGDLFAFSGVSTFAELSGVIQSSPHIALYAQRTRVQHAQLRVVQANDQPDIAWSAGVRRLQGVDEIAFVAGISVPLFTKQRNLGEYEAQRARLDLIQQEKQSNLRDLLHTVNTALGEQRQALLEVETIQNNVIPPLEEALELVENAYLDGRFSYLEWVTTRKEFLSTRLAIIRAATQYHLSKAEIEALTGISLTSEPITPVALPLEDDTAQFNKK